MPRPLTTDTGYGLSGDGGVLGKMEVYWVMKVYNIWNTEYVGADAGIECMGGFLNFDWGGGGGVLSS